MSKDFARLYNHPEYGQVLVLLKSDEENNPSLSFMVVPPGLDVCCASFSWKDNDEGWKYARESFEDVDEEAAFETAQMVIEGASQLAEEAKKGDDSEDDEFMANPGDFD